MSPIDGVLANDTDADNLPPASPNFGLTVTVPAVSGPSHAQSFTLNADGSFSYTPVADYNGPNSFDYQICDGTSLCGTATVDLTVDNVNDVPVANDDPTTPGDPSFTTLEDTPITFDVLANDTDADLGSVAGDTLTVNSAADGSHGTVTNNGTDVTYSPAANWYGTDAFTYSVRDAAGAVSNTATVTVIVNPVDDAPIASDDSYSIDEDNVLIVPSDGVLGNDADPDNLTGPFNAGLSVDPTAVATPAHANVANGGSFTLYANGRFEYQPDSNFNS